MIEHYRRATRALPGSLADKIYRNRDNLAFCKEHNIRLSGPAIGRPKKDEQPDRNQNYMDECERVEVERRFSLVKRKCNLGLVTAKLVNTAYHCIAMSVVVLNLRKLMLSLHLVIEYWFGWINLKKCCYSADIKYNRSDDMNLKGSKINFLGDSITEGCGSSSADKRFTNLILQRYGAVCRNYGIGGTRIALQHTPSEDPVWDRNFTSRVDEMDPDADAVVVFGGTNDFGHGDAPIGKMEDRTAYTFYGALHVLFASLLTKYPKSKIVTITPLHRCNEDDPRGEGNKKEDVGTLYRYVAIIREVAEYYSIPVLDLFACSGLQPCVPIIRQMYLPDGLHPNDAGHVILAEKIADFLMVL